MTRNKPKCLNQEGQRWKYESGSHIYALFETILQRNIRHISRQNWGTMARYSMS